MSKKPTLLTAARLRVRTARLALNHCEDAVMFMDRERWRWRIELMRAKSALKKMGDKK